MHPIMAWRNRLERRADIIQREEGKSKNRGPSTPARKSRAPPLRMTRLLVLAKSEERKASIDVIALRMIDHHQRK